jgi:hypothetical protein
VLALYLAGAVSGALAIWVSYISAGGALLLASFILVTVLLAIAMLEKAPYERQAVKS